MLASVLIVWSLAGIPQCTEMCLGDEQVRLADAARKRQPGAGARL
jgi:hypothetical protein